MRLPLSWLTEYAPLPPGVSSSEVARRLTVAGLEVESVEQAGHDISGVVIAQVLSIEDVPAKKPIRYCRVSAGPAGERWVICGAVNFTVGDRVPLALPGARLTGGVEISARKSYGRTSDGMICAPDELGIGDDHTGIMVLPPDAPLGADFARYAGLADEVLDLAITPDKGYALSVRGVARELAIAFGVDYTDPADTGVPGDVAAVSPEVYPASIADPSACDRFVLREVQGINPAAPAPAWMRVRLARAGMRSVSLAVDVTNYLMLELGQPLHAFDRDRLTGPIVVRRARPGERLETLDHVVRDLDPDDILIADASGPISMAGTMGGLWTEVSESSRDLVLEAAHFSASGTARMSRRHRLSSEASARFERGVDRELPLRASAKAVAMLASLGGGTVVPGCSHAEAPVQVPSVTMAASYPGRVAGLDYPRDTVLARLRQVGCEVSADGAAGGSGSAPGGQHMLTVVPPSWRPDLRDPADLAEEVIRLEGYEHIPVRAARAPAGRGLTPVQRTRRTIGRVLAATGYVEVLSTPFRRPADADLLHLPPGDPRRDAVRLVNPVRDEEPLLRTTLLPGLLQVLARNIGRGFPDVALFELGTVFRQRPGGPRTAPILPVDRAPADAEIRKLDDALPVQALHLGLALAGDRELPGWWGKDGRRAGWDDAVEAARQVAAAAGLSCEVRAAREEPWHPGRCAAVYVPGADGKPQRAGYAGELHPRVIQAFGLPPRACAAELDISLLENAAATRPPVAAPVISSFPVASQDVALSVPESVPAAVVEAALVSGAATAGSGIALEDVRLFDLYTGEQAGAGRKSLAYTLRFRAADRTLTAGEVSAAREAAVSEAERRTGAVLRGG
jgi:phenylalanyl-tRNA synthetase beta chain